ncbi:glycogen/starch/alpha-glucan family phosphorylase [Volucribacter amazonae]|uniref:Alpha-1,4 glucan phosphorylase n=1 Tax=Volucribacter amazonae TaxID=256731 RepID=A0A9X4PD96_9PAST|nr:glycogen/starch/alpha-glucan family phosphorylase [Volucribacter amazonae]MDG6895129.1 maltodextrin phosphorylase [Volucribacter amazonae]
MAQQNFNPFEQLVKKYCRYFEVNSPKQFNLAQWYQILAEGTRDIAYQQLPNDNQKGRHVNYLSMEFLIGRLTGNNLINLGYYDMAKAYLQDYGVDIVDVLEQETDPALGNGGLGRLAACFLDSMATLGQAATGYGLNYQYGLFKQHFAQGKQQETADFWDREHYPWQTYNASKTQYIGFAGSITHIAEDRYHWQPDIKVQGKAYDLAVVGYQNKHLQTLRLWQADNELEFNFAQFNEGEFLQAESQIVQATALTKVLYPNDNHQAGQRLRLMQQYFHVACSVADILARHLAMGYDIKTFAQHQVIQLNDTHPTLAILELMRVLLDEYHLAWQQAWDICCHSFAYTNHTLLPEALEQWDQHLFQQLFPRHFIIVEKINQLFQQQVQAKFGDNAEIWKKVAILYDYRVRMANLCVVTCFKVNGVAEIHSQLLITELFPEYYQLFPQKFCNVTNGITPRRWIYQANPSLSGLLTKSLPKDWLKDLTQLSQIEKYVDDIGFRDEYQQIKQYNKHQLAKEIALTLDLKVNPQAIFDVQIKRIHEYKRQHLNLLNIIATYQALKANPNLDITPRLFIFAGKAAPGYYLAKDIICAINRVAKVINQDKSVRDKLQVAFLPNYRVSLAEKIIPAADISEQISMAGTEASGTGNMKLALNGALTVGTLDGANVEIAQMVGEQHIFLFGHTVESVRKLLATGYNPRDYYQQHLPLKQAIDFLSDPLVCGNEPQLFKTLQDNLINQDPFLVLADFASYVDIQKTVGEAYGDQQRWWQSAILNTARLGMFSSDRAIADYQQRIWLK